MREIEKGAGAFAASIGLSMVITAGYSWYETAIGWGIGVILWMLLPARGTEGNGGCLLRLIYSMVLIGVVLGAAERAFPRDDTFPFVSLGLMLLTYRTLTGAPETGELVANVLGLLMLFFLLLILITGMGELAWGELKPRGMNWGHIIITTGIGAPMWSSKKTKGNLKWVLAGSVMSVLLSAVVEGTLGTALKAYSRMPFYDAMQTIRVFGKQQYMEAIAAVGVLIGSYGMLCWSGDILKSTVGTLVPIEKEKCLIGGMLALSFLGEWVYISGGYTIKESLSATFWGCVVILTLWMAFLRKSTKNEKSA